jgi:hypothetical protein
VLGGLLYWRFGGASPYVVGAMLVLIPLVMAVGLPAPRPQEATS